MKLCEKYFSLKSWAENEEKKREPRNITGIIFHRIMTDDTNQNSFGRDGKKLKYKLLLCQLGTSILKPNCIRNSSRDKNEPLSQVNQSTLIIFFQEKGSNGSQCINYCENNI